MSKRKFGGALLASSLLVFSAITVTTLSSCGTHEKAAVLTKLEISNKEELKQEWKEGTSGRKVSLNFETKDEKFNIVEAVNNGTVKITSSNTDVIQVSNLYLNVFKPGTSTITVSCGNLSDSVEVTVTEVKKVTIADIYTKAKGDFVKFDAVYEGTFSQTPGEGMFFTDGTNYVTVKQGSVGSLEVGSHAQIIGQVAIKNGFLTVTSSRITKIETSAAKAGSTLDFTDFDVVDVKMSGRKVKAVGTVTKFYGPDSYGNAKFSLKLAGGDTVKVTADSRYVKKDIINELLKVHNGYNVTIEGNLAFDDYKKNEVTTNKTKAFIVNPTFGEQKEVAATALTLSADKETFEQDGSTNLKVAMTPANSTAKFEYEITDGSEFIKVDVDKVIGLKPGTAKIVAKVGNLKSNEITLTVTEPVAEAATLDTIYNKAKGDKVKVYGICTGINPQSKRGVFLGDGEKSAFIYGAATLPEGFKVGSYCEVEGEIDNFNGLQQIKNAKITVQETNKAKEPTTYTVTDPEAITSSFAARKAKVSGTVVADAKPDSHGSVKFDVKLANGKTFVVNADNRDVTAEDLKVFQGLKANAKVNLEGFISFYNGAQLVTPTVSAEEVPEVNATAVALSADKETIKINEEALLTAKLTPADATTAVTFEVKSGAAFVTLSGNKVTGKAAGVATIVAKAGTIVSNEIKITVTAEVNDPLAGAEVGTIADLNAISLDTCGIKEGKKLYKVKAIVDAAEDSKFGNVTFTDRETGASLKTYGFGGTASTMTVVNGAYKLSNPKNFNTEVLGKTMNIGDEVEIYIYKYKVWDGDTNGSYEAALSKVLTPADKINNYELKNLPAELTASKTTGLKHGEVITLTPSASIPADKEIKSVKHNGTEVKAEADGTYKIHVSAFNKIEVTLKNKGEVESSVTITAESLGLGSYSNVDTTVSAGGLTFVHKKLMKGSGNSIQMKKDEGYIYLSAPSKLAIASIEVTSSADWTSPAELVCKFGTEKVTTAENVTGALAFVDLKTNETKSINSNVANAKYFVLSAYSHAINLTSIKINYVVA